MGWDEKTTSPESCLHKQIVENGKKVAGPIFIIDAHVWDWDTDEGTRNRWLMVPRKLEKTREKTRILKIYICRLI